MFEKKEICLGCWKVKKIYFSGHCKECAEKKSRTRGMMSAGGESQRRKGRGWSYKAKHHK